jgi:PEP-CTERM motif
MIFTSISGSISCGLLCRVLRVNGNLPSSLGGSLTAMKADATLCIPELPFALRRRSIACFAALALLASVTPARAALVVNGSFELTTLGASGQVHFNTGDVTGWTASTVASVPLGFLYFSGHAKDTLADQFGATDFKLAQAPTYPASSPDGGNFLAFDAAPAYQSSFFQSISGLKVGWSYILSFYQAAGQQNGALYNQPTTEQWKVTFGGQTFVSTLMNNPVQSFTPWNTQTMRFTADATTQILTFLSQGGPDGLPPFVFLDGVNLVETTPEPSTLLYAGIGVGLIAAWRLRNKRT